MALRLGGKILGVSGASTNSEAWGEYMRVLCLGATGRLGQMLRRAWRAERRLQPIWQGRRTAPEPEFLLFDILRDTDALKSATKMADVVLCLAGVTPAPDAALSLNRDLACAACDATDGRPLLVASSAAVYGRPDGLCREGGPARPITAYGQAKLEMERAVLDRGGTVTCLRIGNVAGADQILGRAADRAPITLDRFADGRTPARSYIGPITLARQLADLALAAGRGAGLPPVLNLAAPGEVTMGQLLDAVPYPWTSRPAPSAAIAKVVLDTKRLSGFTTLDPASGQARHLVAEWQADRENAKKATQDR